MLGKRGRQNIMSELNDDKSKHTITRAPLTKQSEKNFAYLTYTDGLIDLTGTEYDRKRTACRRPDSGV